MEILSILEQIAKITYQIQIIYIRLTLLEVSRDIEDNYVSLKKQYLEELFLLKEQEDEAYKPLEADYTIVTSAIEVMNRFQGRDVSEKMESCQKRIFNRLQSIAFNCGIAESSTDLMESFIEEEFFATLYLDKGYSKEELLKLIDSLYPKINKSIAYQYLGTLNIALDNHNNFDIRRLLLNLKFDYLFQKGDIIESDFLRHNFNSIPLSLNEELSRISIPEHLKQLYLDNKIKDIIIFTLLPILAAITDKEMGLEELIWFKTYILYLSKECLNDVKNTVSNYCFNYSEIKKLLLKTISDLDVIKKEHNNSKGIEI